MTNKQKIFIVFFSLFTLGNESHLIFSVDNCVSINNRYQKYFKAQNLNFCSSLLSNQFCIISWKCIKKIYPSPFSIKHSSFALQTNKYASLLVYLLFKLFKSFFLNIFWQSPFSNQFDRVNWLKCINNFFLVTNFSFQTHEWITVHFLFQTIRTLMLVNLLFKLFKPFLS